MSRRRDPAWRDRAAADLLVGCFDGLDLLGPILVMQDHLPTVRTALCESGLDVSVFDRRAFEGKNASPWPPSGPFALATLRLPRGKAELSMSLSAAASVLVAEGSMLLYGAKDEGIQAASRAIGDFFSKVDTVAIGNRCRVLRGVGAKQGSGVARLLEEWKTVVELDHPGLPNKWTSYPGVFSHGRLDDGTRLLLDSLPSFPPGARVLDYGCGSGLVGYLIQQRVPEVALELLDVDAVALRAAGENVPGCRFHLRDGLPPLEMGPYHAIVSNPPFHQGKTENPQMIVSLIKGTPALLRPDGMLVFVAQKRLTLKPALTEHFRDVEILAEDSAFRVWKSRKPRKKRGN